MNQMHPEDHGPGLVIAHNGLGQVSVCGCGVLTLTVACVSLRLEPAAFQELVHLVHQAHHTILTGDAASGPASVPSPQGGKGSPVH